MEHFSGKIYTMGDDIDTDIIMPTEYLALPSVEDMKPYAFRRCDRSWRECWSRETASWREKISAAALLGSRRRR